MLPTYVFVACLAATIVIGIAKTLASGGHPAAVAAPPPTPASVETATIWLIVRAFAGGCAALTGVEAVSNGVTAFRDPVVRTAQRTLAIIVSILAVLLLGLGVPHPCVSDRSDGTRPPRLRESPLPARLRGRRQGPVLLRDHRLHPDRPRAFREHFIRGFPPDCAAPWPRMATCLYGFAVRGRRLVYSSGIYVVSILSAILLIVFGGVTDQPDTPVCDRSIPFLHPLASRDGRALA